MACSGLPEKWKNGGKRASVATTRLFTFSFHLSSRRSSSSA